MRVAGGRADILVPEHFLNLLQVETLFVEERGRGSMSQTVGGDDRDPAFLARRFEPGIERFICSRLPVAAREHGRGRGKVEAACS